MQQHKVKFKIAKGGKISFEVVDGQGEACTLATRDLQVTLSKAGNQIDEGKLPEYYEGTGGISVFSDLNE